VPGSISLQNVVVSRSGRSLFRVDRLELWPGRLVVVLGENGCGKSTLLRLLAGLERLGEGEIRYGAAGHAQFYAGGSHPREVLLLSQDAVLFDHSVERNVAYGLRLAGLPVREARARAMACLRELRIEHLARRRAPCLSGGEARRVALARVLALEPRFLLLDEPFAGLDPDSRVQIEGRLSRLGEAGRTMVLLTTHQTDLALRLAHEVYQVADGRLAAYHPVNVFHGEAVRRPEGGVFRTGAIEVEIPAFDHPPRAIHVPPTDLLLSRAPLDSSARNCFAGTIRALELQGAAVQVSVAAGVPFTAVITAASLRDLGLRLGEPVCVSFKVSSVRLL